MTSRETKRVKSTGFIVYSLYREVSEKVTGSYSPWKVGFPTYDFHSIDIFARPPGAIFDTIVRLFPDPSENEAVFTHLSHNLSGTAVAAISGGMKSSALNAGDAVPTAELFRKPGREETIPSRVAGSERESLWVRKSLKRREGLKEIDM